MNNSQSRPRAASTAFPSDIDGARGGESHAAGTASGALQGSGPAGTATSSARPGAAAPTSQSQLSPLRQLRLAFGFFTVLPSGGAGSLEDIARSGWLLPLVGLVLGGAEGLLLWLAARIFGAPAAGALTLAAALLLSGLHHADGLADLGDALMAHGDAARRLEVLKDRAMGVGALAALFITGLITWSSLVQVLAVAPRAGSGLQEALYYVCLMAAVEVCARLALMICAAASRPSHEGSGSAFIESMKGFRAGAGFALGLTAIAALAAVTGWPSAAALAAAAVTGIGLSLLARRIFGGANGDVLGAAVELGRAAALLGMLAVLVRA